MALELTGERGQRYRQEPAPEPQLAEISGRLVCNMGLWLKVPDISGLDKIGNEPPDAVASKEDMPVIAPGTTSAFALIMNVGFPAESVRGSYQLPLGVEINKAPLGRLDRFVDLWSGDVLKRQNAVALGMRPVFRHQRSSARSTFSKTDKRYRPL